jgi:hypothetical protein
MANKNILTYNAKITEIEQNYFSPVAVLPSTGQEINTMYCFLSRAVPWSDDLNPDAPSQSTAYLKNVYKNIFVIKKIQSSDISGVIERKDWVSGTIYDYYRDDIDMLQKDPNGYLVLNFYIRNQYDQVFKCLWNNKGAPSVNQPFFQPGTYGTNNIYQGADGYKWKYIYTVDIGSKTKFMDTLWMPVPIVNTTLDPLATSAGCGDIEVINVTNAGGTGYFASNTTVLIVGDGSGASANVSTLGGAIQDFTIINAGKNYSYANVSVISSSGSSANISAPISPIGGHGFDAISELGCSHMMITSSFNGSEGGFIPTNIDYCQVGIINNPLSIKTYPNFANSSIYSTTTDFVVVVGAGEFTPDETIYQGADQSSLASGTATFTATVLSFNPLSNVIKLINISGNPAKGSLVYGNISQTARVLSDVNSSDYITFSGKINYIENRSSVARSSDGIEQFKFVLGY